MMPDISRDEFQGWMKTLREDIRGVHTRLDQLNDRTRATETDIAVLKDRAIAGKGSAAAWGGGIGGVVAGLIEVAKWVSGK